MTTTKSRRRLEYLPLDQVKPAKRNPKLHDDDTLDASMDRFGFTEPVLLDERTGRLVAGHGRIDRLRAAHKRGDDPPDGIQVMRDGSWKVPVVRGWSSVDDAEAEAYLIASNRLVETGGWEPGTLADLLAPLAEHELGLVGVGYTDVDLHDLLDSLHDPSDIEGDEEAPVPEPPSKPTTRMGDVWLLGSHRLMCGDSTEPATLEQLMVDERAEMLWTDPPYGVEYVGKTSDGLTIDNDNVDDAALESLLRQGFKAAQAVSAPGAVWIVAAPAGPQLLQFATVLSEMEIWRQGLVWVKDRFALGHSDYHYRHEVLFFGWVPGASHQAPRDRTHDSVFEVARPSRSEEHPTMKPVALVSQMLLNHTVRGQIILDPFGGSGTTLLAAEETGRLARLVELSPGYCDVICERFERETGIVPVLERTGKARSFVKSTPAT